MRQISKTNAYRVTWKSNLSNDFCQISLTVPYIIAIEIVVMKFLRKVTKKHERGGFQYKILPICYFNSQF